MELLKSELVRSALASSPTVSLLKKTVPNIDQRLMRLSRGWLNTGLQTTALVTARGARSGEPRPFVTLAMPAGNDLILVASNWGGEKHPAWYFNLKQNPEVDVLFRGFNGKMATTELAGRERSSMWERLVSFNPQYATYQAGTRRRIPVLQLRRVQG